MIETKNLSSADGGKATISNPTEKRFQCRKLVNRLDLN